MVCKIAFYTVLLSILCFAETIHAQKSPEELLDELIACPLRSARKSLRKAQEKKASWFGIRR